MHLKPLAVLALAAFLASCSTVESTLGITSTPSPSALLYSAESVLTAAAQAADACKVTKVCPPAVQATVYNGLVTARNLMGVAEVDVLGCPLAQYVAANSTPPTASCPVPTASTAQATLDITAAQTAATAAQSAVPTTTPAQ
jgi:hypothetical protein